MPSPLTGPRALLAPIVERARKLRPDLPEVRLVVNGRLRRACARVYSRGKRAGRLEVSRQFLALPEEEQRSTLVHEVAHLLAPHDGHGLAWKSAHRRLDPTLIPERTINTPAARKALLATGNVRAWTVWCPKCDATVGYHEGFRRPRKYDQRIHTRCGSRVLLRESEVL